MPKIQVHIVQVWGIVHSIPLACVSAHVCTFLTRRKRKVLFNLACEYRQYCSGIFHGSDLASHLPDCANYYAWWVSFDILIIQKCGQTDTPFLAYVKLRRPLKSVGLYKMPLCKSHPTSILVGLCCCKPQNRLEVCYLLFFETLKGLCSSFTPFIVLI